MKTIPQLLRQPGRTLAGVLMMALGVAALIVCFGQNIAADRAQRQMEASFRTAALVTDALQQEIRTYEIPGQTITYSNGVTQEIPPQTVEYTVYSPLVPAEVSAWVERLPETYPELVKEVADHGFLSAYIPELTPDHYASCAPDTTLTYLDGKLAGSMSDNREPTPYGTPYDYGVFEITMTKVGVPEEIAVRDPETGEVTEVLGAFLILEGTIDRIFALQDGCPPCEGYTLHMYLNLPDLQTAENLDLEEGARYLVSGYSYYDLDWVLRNEIMNDYLQRQNRNLKIDVFEPENLRIYDQKILDKYESYGQSVYNVGYYMHGEEIIILDNVQYSMLRTVYLELDWAENYGSGEEYLSRYALPNLMRLEGTTEEFLASPEGELWNEHLDTLDVNAHCFPVLAVEELGNVAEFLRGSARVTQGRAFTREESLRGERLCLISEQVAAAAGLTVGDTVTLRPYAVDRENPRQSFLEEGVGITNPAAYRYGKTTPFLTDGETYTIVGLYRYGGAWASVEDNLYSITPNTVFVPSASVSTAVSKVDQGVFRTVVLRNDSLREFIIAAEDAGYGELFVYYDQGYHQVAQNIEQYRVMAGRAMLVGGIIYGVILLLYLVLFPAGLERNLILMDSLGANRFRRMGHVAASSLGILLSGTILGCAGGAVLWNRVVAYLTEQAEVALELRLDLWGFLRIAGGQLALAMGLILLLSLWMTRPRILAGRK